MKSLLSGTWVVGMKNRNLTVLALALLALAGTATRTLAQSTYTPYAFTNFAGTPGGSGSADGTGSAARFNYPAAAAVDSAGNVYVADEGNHTVRKITPAGVVTTLAGLAGSYGSADGTGSAARFGGVDGAPGPTDLAVDGAGNVYVADNANHTIRKITPGGVVTTFAGLAGNPGSADGTGSAARFNDPVGVAVDSTGNLYVADAWNSTIRKITPGGVVRTLAGLALNSGSADGTGSIARFNQPCGVTADSAGNVYVADTYNYTIRKITPGGTVTTLAGLAGSYGSADGTGSAARFGRASDGPGPAGVAVDSAGNVYVADGPNHTLRRITPAGVVTTLAGLAGNSGSADGTGSAARFSGLFHMTVDSTDNIYGADAPNNTIRKVTPAGVVSTLAGLRGNPGSADGTGSAAQFSIPEGVAVDSGGNIYVADTPNQTIRKMTPQGVVTTLAGLAGNTGSNDGAGSAARFRGPIAVAVDSGGNVYVPEWNNCTIRKITPAGVVTTLAGLAGSYGSADGTGSAARFGNADAGPTGVAVDSAGNVYVADYVNCTIRKVTPAGVVTTLAGLAGNPGSADGTGSAARFYAPTDVAVDSTGNVNVTDGVNCTIRKITPAGVVTTLAGLAGNPGSADGTGSAARFDWPRGLAVDSTGNIYVADQHNSTIRKITPQGVVTTLAGLAGTAGSADGTGSAARFSSPQGVAVDSAGNLYVVDTDNNRITKGTPCVPYAAAATATVVNGFVVGVNITDGGCGYTNTPTVRIIGNGSGAQAEAVVSNAVVTAVNVLVAGSGYTTPIIVIEPPFIPQPTMRITVLFFGPLVTPVLELDLANLSPYDKYQLEFTPVAGGTWSNLGSIFTPTAATSIQYANAVGTAGFLRVKYVP